MLIIKKIDDFKPKSNSNLNSNLKLKNENYNYYKEIKIAKINKFYGERKRFQY